MANLFTDDEVASINAYQASGAFHPFTCCDHQAMRADRDGMHCDKCGNVQTWVHDWMRTWGWREFDTFRQEQS